MNAATSMRVKSESSEGLVEGDLLLTYEDFRRIAAMLHDDAGIALHDSKATLVYSRLAKRLRALGLRTFRDYCALVASTDGIDERKRMLAALTTNVTRFFREPHHFDHLKTRVLPGLLDEARRGGRVRLWSAGCSTGQEPYSLALTIAAMAPDAMNLDLKILATDIDTNVLAEAKEGLYGEEAISAVPSDLRQRWFVPAPEQNRRTWRVSDDLRRLVSFRELNLIGDWPMRGPFQVIFCRNVVIYFEEATQIRIWERFRRLMSPDAWLYIGHSERVAECNGLETAGLTTYRRRGNGI